VKYLYRKPRDKKKCQKKNKEAKEEEAEEMVDVYTRDRNKKKI
jgi:hypothetical protein